jgi:hypothetical protein
MSTPATTEAPVAELPQPTPQELTSFVGSTISFGTLRDIRLGRRNHNGHKTFVVKARLTSAADPNQAGITVALSKSFERATGVPADVHGGQMLSDQIVVKVWHCRATRLDPTGLGEWDLCRRVTERIWAGVLERLLSEMITESTLDDNRWIAL